MTLPRCVAALLLGCLLIFGPAPAQAHRLKLFVTVEGNTVSGYAFFVGGGRAESVALTITDPTGAVVQRGTTDRFGAFTWTAPHPESYRISVDTGDGHVVERVISAELFTAGAPLPASAAPAPAERSALDPMIEAAIERALARQLRPLIEAQDQAESRLRFNDIMGGIGMIVGLAGLGMWAKARRRPMDRDRE
jgi:nickel transport protein